jgi:hypothetical protein
MYGTFAPVRLLKVEAGEFKPGEIVGFEPPQGSKVLALPSASGLKPRGWIHDGNKSFYFASGSKIRCSLTSCQ